MLYIKLPLWVCLQIPILLFSSKKKKSLAFTWFEISWSSSQKSVTSSTWTLEPNSCPYRQKKCGSIGVTFVLYLGEGRGGLSLVFLSGFIQFLRAYNVVLPEDRPRPLPFLCSQFGTAVSPSRSVLYFELLKLSSSKLQTVTYRHLLSLFSPLYLCWFVHPKGICWCCEL